MTLLLLVLSGIVLLWKFGWKSAATAPAGAPPPIVIPGYCCIKYGEECESVAGPDACKQQQGIAYAKKKTSCNLACGIREKRP